MIRAISQITALQQVSSTNKKLQILQKFKDNEDFRKLLYYALNPLLTYKVSEQTLRRPVEYTSAITLTMLDIYTICETLSQRKALDDVAVYQVCSFLQLCSPHETEFYTKLLAKTLRLGITAKTVNKVIPGLIPEWKVQQAYPIEKYPLKDGVWFSLTQKLNGVRATYYKGKLYARSGVPFEGLEHITNAFLWDTTDGLVFDGELTLRDKGELSDNEAFRVATGIINSDDDDKTMICYTIFDVIPTVEFERGESVVSYRGRRPALAAVEATLPKDGSVSVLPVLYSGTDLSKIDKLLERMVREDKEGLMVNLNVPYRCRRHNGILKVKRFYTMDLPITHCEEGTGRLSGTLGAFVLDYNGNEVRVGSGFTDEQRLLFWEQKEDIVGTLCEVKYKEISSDKNTGANSLQFPVFVSLRTDKEDISYA
jgi:DNA ligase-1